MQGSDGGQAAIGKGQVHFRDVADAIRRQIDGGTYPPGRRLPSEGFLAKNYGCSRDTIRDALAVLVIEGHVVKRRGTPATVRPAAQRVAIELPPDAAVIARPMTFAEADALGCGPGIAVFEVRTGGPGGTGRPTVYRGDLHTLTTPPAN